MNGNILAWHAKEKAEMGADWHVYSWEVKESPYGSYYEMKGVVAPHVKTKGKNKRQRNSKLADKTTERTIAITQQEHETWVKEWEKRTGICSDCENTGRVFASWNIGTGVKYKPCKCGKAEVQQQSLLDLSGVTA